MNTHLIHIMEVTALSLAIWFLYWEYREFRIAELRQKLFEIRDAFFSEATAGKINFDSPAYAMTRTTLNGMIRFAHELSLIRLLVFRMFIGRHVPVEVIKYRRAYEEALKTLHDEQQRVLIRDVRVQMDIAVVRYLALTSPILFIIFVMAALLILMRVILRSEIVSFRRAANIFAESQISRGQNPRRAAAYLEAEAYALGTLS